MPARGYRDEDKRLWRELLAGYKELNRERYASWMEHRAKSKAAYRREPDLPYLVKIPMLQDRDGLSPYTAAGKVADEIGGDARLRHANRKKLYGKFQKAPGLYRRLALASEDPSDAAEREICEAIRTTPRAEWEALSRARQSDYRARLSRWAHEALKQDELARAIHAACTFKDEEEFARAYRAVRDILNSFK
jgi:hypothetical protein